MKGDLDARRTAIAAGGDPNARDGAGRTALHLAIAVKDVEAVRFLIEHGADWELKDEQGFTATDGMYAEKRAPWGVDFELKRGYKAILGVLQEAVLTGGGSLTFLNRDQLFSAIQNRRVTEVQDALDDAGVWDVDIRLADGTTPLHLAVERGNARVVAALLDHTKTLTSKGRTRTWPGPDITRRNEAGETPLDVARRLGEPAILGLLEAYAARGGGAASPEAPARDPDGIVAEVIAATGTLLGQAHDLEGLPLPVVGLTFVADEVSCAAVVVAADPWTSPFDGRKVEGRFVTEEQTLLLAEATDLDPVEAFDRLLHRVTARLRRDGAPFLQAGAAVVHVEHGGLEPARHACAAADAALDASWWR
ncbi:MAG: hypothetical protein H6734_28495 [Alphaproteobacteria bacterium]|nr:hypothetical protein [Alphaproteobacteria bacterium]